MQAAPSNESVRPRPPIDRYPLIDAILNRRSRRFARGAHLDGGPLTYHSAAPPDPLSIDEQAALAFAACGITGYALAELPFQPSPAQGTGSGNILTHFAGRTIGSGDAIHSVIVFVIDDSGAWMLKRPQDYPRAELPDLIAAARAHRLVELYNRARVRIADRRIDVPRSLPFVPPFNTWSANLQGSTYFLPIHELSALYINIVLAAFSEQFGYTILDERNRFRPTGIERFLRSRGGYLDDNPRHGRVATIGFSETWLCEFSAWEEGAIMQNLALMAEALGLGGYPHFAAYPAIWMQALGFRMYDVPFSRTIGAGRVLRRVLRATGRDVPVPTAIGLERGGDVLIKPFCPPYYGSMKDAVLAFIDTKFGAGSGTFRDGGTATAFRDGAAIQRDIPRYSDRQIAATIAYCEYVYARYGRFPASSGPFRTLLAYQAHRLDPSFYDRFYRPNALYTAHYG